MFSLSQPLKDIPLKDILLCNLGVSFDTSLSNLISHISTAMMVFVHGTEAFIDELSNSGTIHILRFHFLMFFDPLPLCHLWRPLPYFADFCDFGNFDNFQCEMFLKYNKRTSYYLMSAHIFEYRGDF